MINLHVAYQVISHETNKLKNVTIFARISLTTGGGMRFTFVAVVRNFMNFNAVGVIIMAMVGVGVVERAGLVNALIRKIVIVAPPAALTYILVFVRALSSIAADAGRMSRSFL
jgi:aminobenzoyl-glutamate transport protein